MDRLFLDSSLISKFRTHIMGLATIMILMCHAPAHINNLPLIVKVILSYGSIGVDIFLVLSGFGLFFSLQNYKTKIVFWYWKRYIRLLIPCIIVQLLFVTNEGVVDFIKFSTGISFWDSHRGFWFVDLLFILYLVYPLIYTCIYKRKKIYDYLLFFICILIYLLPVFYQTKECVVLGNILSVCQYVPSFIIGGFLARCASLKSPLQYVFIMLCIAMCGVFKLIEHFVHVPMYPGLPVSMIIIYIAVLILQYIEPFRGDMLVFFGSISLESYLINVSLPTFLHDNIGSLNISDWVFYMFVIISGTLVSVVVNKLSKFLSSKI